MYLFHRVAEEIKEHLLCHAPDMSKHLVACNYYYSQIHQLSFQFYIEINTYGLFLTAQYDLIQFICIVFYFSCWFQVKSG